MLCMIEQSERDYSLQGNYGNSAPPGAPYGGPSSGMAGPAGPGYHSNYQQYGYDNYYQQPPPAPPPPYSGVSHTASYHRTCGCVHMTEFIVTGYRANRCRNLVVRLLHYRYVSLNDGDTF